MELHRQASANGQLAPADCTTAPSNARQAELAELLLGIPQNVVQDVPALADLASAVASLATGLRQKVLLPLASSPGEYALVRRGPDILISYYDTGPAPEVVVLNRPVAVLSLLQACEQMARDAAALENDSVRSQVLERVAERAAATAVVADALPALEAVRRRGGALRPRFESAPLTFAFTVAIPPGTTPMAEASTRADVHALLFEGELWGWVRGRRLELARGPVMLTALRALSAVRMLVDAWQAGRQANIRLRTGSFLIGARLDRSGEVTVTLGNDGHGTVTATALDVPGATLPMLKLVSDLLRALVAADRSQTRNLRVRSTREEVRALRRLIRTRTRSGGFVNSDPDRFRTSARVEDDAGASPARMITPQGRLRFSERWCVDLQELDAGTTFMCGDRLVIATPRRAVALSREGGELLWARDGNWTHSMMAGQTLVHLTADGEAELCDVVEGEPYAVGRFPAMAAPPPRALYVGGGRLPPAVVLTVGTSKLVAIDLRTGQSRWELSADGPSPIRVTRAGRALIAASAHAVDAVDVTSGEVVWRFTTRQRLQHDPVVAGDTVLVATTELGGSAAGVYAIDLLTGETRWFRELDLPATTAPLALGRNVGLAVGGHRRASLAALRLSDGELAWMVPDPGLGLGAAPLCIDDKLVLNGPNGRISAIDVESGELRWHRDLADPVADEVPRRLEPVLRGGALFVPAANVHVLRPSDGTAVGPAIPSDLVPDLIRVDERGWVYVAEETGHLAAYAPVPHLQLIRGGS